MSVLKKYIIIFLISMVPLIELRGAIPVSQGFQLPVIQSFIVCMIGNMIPVPIIYFFARKVLEWGKKFAPVKGDDGKDLETKIASNGRRYFFLLRWFGKFCNFCIEKGEKGGRKLTEKAGRGTFVALLLFVGIPLPGTGAWTGTLAASILDLGFKKTVLAVVLGVLLAGIIMMTLSYFGFAALFGIAG